MARSLQIRSECIGQVKQALMNKGFPRQVDLAEDLGLALSTVSNFLNGKPVGYLNFLEICRKLELEVQQVSDFSESLDWEAIENKGYRTIEQPGSLLHIQANPREDKTELINKIVDRAKQKEYQIVNLNLLLTDGSILTGIEEFFKWFCRVITKELKEPSEVEQRWEPGLGSSYNCNLYFEEYLLPKLDTPFLLILDNIERLYSFPRITDDFLSLLRFWHENAKSEELWQKLRLVLGYKEEYLGLDINRSPFNVGVKIQLGGN
jgi:hypothetical protein